MKPFFIVLTLALLLQFSASAQQKPPLKSLNVGNFWIYSYVSSKAPRPDLPRDAYERVVGTQIINGKEYARVFNSYFQQTFLERSDSNNVYRWNNGREILIHSILWKVGDTIPMSFMWHGCNDCRYIVRNIMKDYVPNLLKDTIYSFTLRDVNPRGDMPVVPYVIDYVRKYLVNQLDTFGLFQGRSDFLGGTFLKGAYVDGVVLRDTNIITSVVEDPPLPLAQSSKPNDNPQAASSSARRVAVQMSAENPFSSRTQVRYRLEQAGTVELAVYNAQGVRLATMQRGRQAAGEHTASWNGTSTEGLEVPAGAYFLVLFVDDRQAGEVKVVKVR